MKVENKVSQNISQLQSEIKRLSQIKDKAIFEYEQLEKVSEKRVVQYKNEMSKLEKNFQQLRLECQKQQQQTENIRCSFAYRFGRVFVDAFKRPTIKTVLFPISLSKLFYQGVRKKLKSTHIPLKRVISSPLSRKTIELPVGLIIQERGKCFEFSVCAESTLTIEADIWYSPRLNSKSREALIALKFTDEKEQEISDTSLPFSEKLQTYFQYLPDTKKSVQRIADLKSPESANKLTLNMQSFGSVASNSVVIGKVHFHLSNSSHCQLSKSRPKSQFKISCFDNCEIIIDANINYHCAKNIRNKKSVVLVQFFSKFGEEIKHAPNGMSYSKKFDAQFKYLADTARKPARLLSLLPPVGTDYIVLQLNEFGMAKDESINVSELSVTILPVKEKVEFIAPSKLAAELSILGWPEYKDTGKPVVVGIMDEFTTGCFESDLNLIQPRPDNWYALADKYKPEIFFLESAWKGNFGSWQYRVANYANKPGQEVDQISAYAKANNVPLVFWNKEDPVHHDKFMCSAKVADYIFTTDANMCESYKQKTGNNNVFALPFAAQPELHKPAPLEGRINKSCFAGSWYGNRHAERGESMNWLLSVANEFGLDIYDRNYGTDIFPFPEHLSKGIKGSLPYKALCEEYNRYRIFLNVNSVTDSPTMFSRRVFELMACGTPVVSTYAKGIEELFDSGAVWLVNSEKEAREAIKTLMEDDVEWRRRSLAGMREVFAKHTYAYRINEVLSKTGSKKITHIDPEVILLFSASDEIEVEFAIAMISGQTYKNTKLVIVTDNDLSSKLADNVMCMTEIQAMQYLQDNEEAYAGVIDKQIEYGENYLQDLINATRYQPEAIAWSKSSDDDKFSFGYALCVGATIYNTKAINTFNDFNMLDKSRVFTVDSAEIRLKNKV